MKIVELGMIKLRRQIGSLKDLVKDGKVAVRITEGKAGPPPKNKPCWERATETIGYIVSPNLIHALIDGNGIQRLVQDEIDNGELDGNDTASIVEYIISLF